jgi:hypothetical protein
MAWLAGIGVSVAAGWRCSRIGTPIPRMLGPLVALAALRVSGVPVAAPPDRSRSPGRLTADGGCVG